MQIKGSWKCYEVFSLLIVAAMVQLQHFSASRSIPALERSETDIDCRMCIDSVAMLREAVECNKTWENLLPVIESVCARIFADLTDLNGSFMCPGIIELYGPVVAYVFAELSVEPSYICETLGICVLANKISQPVVANRAHVSHLNLLKVVHESIRDRVKRRLQNRDQQWGTHVGLNDFTKEASKERVAGAYPPSQGTVAHQFQSEGPLRILQLTDVHVDLFYEEGAPTDCGLIICCQPWYPGSGHAGRYGDYNCDLPLATLDLMLDTVNSMDIDFVLYTGDNPPHDLWNETHEGQLLATEVIVNRVSEKLGAKVIYPALGNHETFPESEYLAELPLYQNMTRTIASYWADWFPMSEDAADTISRGGYYTAEVSDGLRIVAINSDYGYRMNFYTLLNEQNTYFYEHRKWVHSVFSMAENRSEKVILLAHIPPNPSDNIPWYYDFLFNITRRYRNTIVGFITGHTHRDQFQLLQDEFGVYSASIVAPSMTTQSGVNPSFRVFSMDRNTFQLLDYEQYHLNLTRANELALEGGEPVFELAYTASDEYGMENLSTESWSALARRLERNNLLLQRYIYNMDGHSGQHGDCDSQCQKEAICSINYPEITLYNECIASC